MKTAETSTTAVLSSFFPRLQSMGEVLRIVIGNASLRMQITMREQGEKHATLDFTGKNFAVNVSEKSVDADVYATVEAEMLHDIFTKKTHPALAVGRRQLLMRGSPSHFANVIPIFDFAPALYAEHLSDLNQPGYERNQNPHQEDSDMQAKSYTGDSIELVKLSQWEKLLFSVLNFCAFLAGFVLGWLRYRVLKNLNLFDTVSALSEGLESARIRSEARKTSATGNSNDG